MTLAESAITEPALYIYSQLQSRFFELPAEIRSEKYSLVLAGDRSPVGLVSPLEPPHRRNTASLSLVPSGELATQPEASTPDEAHIFPQLDQCSKHAVVCVTS